MSTKRKKRKWLFWLLTLIILMGLGLVCYPAFLKKESPIEVQIGNVERRNITEIVTANGKVQPVTYVKISPEVSGEIISLPVKEGQRVKKGDLLFSIKPDIYIASSNSAAASLQLAFGNRDIAFSSLEKWEEEWSRSKKLYENDLLSKASFETVRDSYFSAKTTYTNSIHQVAVSQSALDRASEDLSKCIIYSPLDGTVSQLNSELGERVVGTGTYAGTEVMIISDLNKMEARVEIGEMDINLIQLGQKSWLEVDAFKNKKFEGTVTQIANTATSSTSSSSTEATKFEVRILITEKEAFRPGMSVTAEVETRYRTNVLSVPIQSVTTRMNELAKKKMEMSKQEEEETKNDSVKKDTSNSGIDEVVFVEEGDHVNKRKVTRGISDDNYTEITEGLKEGEPIVIGGYTAIGKKLEDGKLIQKNIEGTKE